MHRHNLRKGLRMDPSRTAQNNLMDLSRNPYPGRGLVIGLTPNGRHIVQIYWIMGRSENSRNRLFDYDSFGRLFTVAADPAKVKDPSLIIYDAMLEKDGCFAVSNGNQTNNVMAQIAESTHLNAMLRNRQYEPDKPNFTSRITGLVNLNDEDQPAGQFLILQKSPFGDATERRAYELNLAPGFGYGIMTYAGDGDPLPPFRGDPLLYPVPGTEISMGAFWSALNPDNRVAIACKAIDLKCRRSTIFVENRFQAVEPPPPADAASVS
jgi:IMP cyclohydrolase